MIEVRNRYTGAVLLEVESLSHAHLRGADLTNADLRGANLPTANLRGADLYLADLRGANLSRAHLIGADLASANLSGANLSRACLIGANLIGANLSAADLSSANLSRANLSRANLIGANLSRANLIGADLSRADLGDQWIVQGGVRSDGYAFFLQRLTGDDQPMVKAGCRLFTLSKAKAHWTETRGGTPLGDETFAIIDGMVAVAKARGLLHCDAAGERIENIYAED